MHKNKQPKYVILRDPMSLNAVVLAQFKRINSGVLKIKKVISYKNLDSYSQFIVKHKKLYVNNRRFRWKDFRVKQIYAYSHDLYFEDKEAAMLYLEMNFN